MRLVIYRIKGAHAGVLSSVFDRFWGLESDRLKVSTDIDIEDKTIWSGRDPLLFFKNNVLNVGEPVKARSTMTDTIEIVWDTLVYYFNENPPLKTPFPNLSGEMRCRKNFSRLWFV